jgi:hypothetical protein
LLATTIFTSPIWGGWAVSACCRKVFNTSSTSQNIQLTETAVINPTTVNEARFQYSVNRNETLGNGTIPD